MCVHACLCVCVFACACACAVRACVLDFQLVLKYVSIHHKRLHVKLYFFYSILFQFIQKILTCLYLDITIGCIYALATQISNAIAFSCFFKT